MGVGLSRFWLRNAAASQDAKVLLNVSSMKT
jgi:hypothetical protein